MATRSYPAVGNGGLLDADWSKMYDCPDGIVNDYDGYSFTMTRNSSANTVTLGPAGSIACVNGYYLELTAEETLSVPTTVAAHVVYAMYDPALNVADGSGNASSAGPCRLVVGTPTPDTTGGKKYLRLAKFTRTTSGQALTSLAAVYYKPFVGPHLAMLRLPPEFKGVDFAPASTGFQYPIGTLIHEMETGEQYLHTINNDGGTNWTKQSIHGPFTFPNTSPLVAAQTNEPARYWFSEHRAVVHLEGTLKRSSGALLTSTGVDVSLGTMPAGALPATQVRFSCVVKKPSKWDNAQVTVQANGLVVLYDPDFDVEWVDLAGISYRVIGR